MLDNLHILQINVLMNNILNLFFISAIYTFLGFYTFSNYVSKLFYLFLVANYIDFVIHISTLDKT